MLNFQTYLEKNFYREQFIIEDTEIDTENDLEKSIDDAVDVFIKELKKELISFVPEKTKSLWDRFKHTISNLRYGSEHEKNPYRWQNKFGSLGLQSESWVDFIDLNNLTLSEYSEIKNIFLEMQSFYIEANDMPENLKIMQIIDKNANKLRKTIKSLIITAVQKAKKAQADKVITQDKEFKSNLFPSPKPQQIYSSKPEKKPTPDSTRPSVENKPSGSSPTLTQEPEPILTQEIEPIKQPIEKKPDEIEAKSSPELGYQDSDEPVLGELERQRSRDFISQNIERLDRNFINQNKISELKRHLEIASKDLKSLDNEAKRLAAIQSIIKIAEVHKAILSEDTNDYFTPFEVKSAINHLSFQNQYDDNLIEKNKNKLITQIVDSLKEKLKSIQPHDSEKYFNIHRRLVHKSEFYNDPQQLVEINDEIKEFLTKQSAKKTAVDHGLDAKKKECYEIIEKAFDEGRIKKKQETKYLHQVKMAKTLEALENIQREVEQHENLPSVDDL